MLALGPLVTHVAYALGLIDILIRQVPLDEIPKQWITLPVDDALKVLDEQLDKAIKTLEGLSEKEFQNETIKAPWGDEDNLSAMLMHMCDHAIHHKMQLFVYLKLLGHDLNTGYLYYGESMET
jgi:uncharacterized damage-inducible protein DinB